MCSPVYSLLSSGANTVTSNVTDLYSCCPHDQFYTNRGGGGGDGRVRDLDRYNVAVSRASCVTVWL